MEAAIQLTKLYNQILQSKKIPPKLKEAKVILLHKKDDKADIKNYRPISLLSVTCVQDFYQNNPNPLSAVEWFDMRFNRLLHA